MSRYFDTARTEIMAHLPDTCTRMLDIGCGTGATTDAVRAVRDVTWAAGVEYDADAADRARPRYDRLWQGDAEALTFDAEIGAELGARSLDLILCLDVLEHLRDPWSVVRRLSPLLAPGGRLIVSVPNIRNWKFILRLLTKGDFTYRDSGLLDRTHLRFFVMPTASELATCGGLNLVSCQSATSYGPMEFRRMLLTLSGGRLEGLIAKQILVVAEQRERNQQPSGASLAEPPSDETPAGSPARFNGQTGA